MLPSEFHLKSNFDTRYSARSSSKRGANQCFDSSICYTIMPPNRNQCSPCGKVHIIRP